MSIALVHSRVDHDLIARLSQHHGCAAVSVLKLVYSFCRAPDPLPVLELGVGTESLNGSQTPKP